MQRSGCRSLAIVLSLLLALPICGVAQQPEGLKIFVISGEGGVNNIEKRVVTTPAVEVRDAQGQPVAGAEVVFRAPDTGPSVSFFGASHTATVTTDEQGRARGDGMAPNTIEGTFPIEITANHGGRQAMLTITQTNVVAPGTPKEKKSFPWRWLTAVGAGVAAGIVIAARSDKNEGPATTSISLGSVGVGAPR